MNKPVFDKALVSETIRLDNLGSLNSADGFAELVPTEIVAAAEEEVRHGSHVNVERADQSLGRSQQASGEGHDGAATPAGAEEESRNLTLGPNVVTASLAKGHPIDLDVAHEANAESGSVETSRWDPMDLLGSTLKYEADASLNSTNDRLAAPQEERGAPVVLDGSALSAEQSQNALAEPSTNGPVETLAGPPPSAGIFNGNTTIDENPTPSQTLGVLLPNDDGYAHSFATVSGQPVKVQYVDGTYYVRVTDPSVYNYETATNHQVKALVKATTYDIETGESSSVLQTLTFTLNDVSEPPIIGLNGPYEVAENQVGFVVGELNITDVEGRLISDVRVQNDSRFFVTKNNGKYYLITYDQFGGANSGIDYETTPNHTLNVTVSATNTAGHTGYQTFNLTVLNGPDAPTGVTINGGSTASIPENSPGDTVVGTLQGQDPDSTSFTYQVLNNDPRFYAVGNLLKVKPGAVLDYETTQMYTVLVRVTDESGLSFDRSLQVNLTNVDEVNHDPDSLSFIDGAVTTTVNEEMAGAVLGTLKGHDIDNDTLTYSIAPGGDPSGRYEVVNGVLKLKDGVSLDYETTGPFHQSSVVVRVSDGRGGFKDQVFTINIADASNDSPNRSPDSLTFTDGTVTATVTEEVTGTVVGALKGHDPDSYDPSSVLKYALAPGGDPSGRFEVVKDASGNPILKLKDGVSLDYESSGPNHSYTVVVRVSDNHGGFFDQALTINVADVPSDPPNRNPDSLTFADGSVAASVNEETPGAIIGALMGHDPDSYDPANALIYSIAPNGDPSGMFTVANGLLKLKNGVSLDYETSGPNHSYTVVVRVSDGHGGFKDQAFTIAVTDVPNDPVNRSPDSLTFADGTIVATVNEETPGAVLGALLGHDPDSYDPANALTYSIAPNGDPSNCFEVVNGVLKLKDGVSLDYETSGPNHSYAVVVRVSDNHGGFLDQTVTIGVTDVPNDPPNRNPDSLTFADGSVAASVNEETPGAIIGTLMGHDPDSYDPANTLVYALAPNGDPSGKFVVVNGLLKLKDGVSLDYESSGPNHSYTVVVRVLDGHGGFKDQAFTINVSDVPNDPVNRSPDSLTFADGTTTASVIENMTGAVVGTLMGHDADISDVLTYSLAPNGDPSGRFEVVNGVLKLKDGVSLDYESSGPNHSYTVVVRVSDNHGGFLDQTVTIGVTDVPNDPINHDPDSLTFTNHQTEISTRPDMPGALIGVLIASDPDPEDAGLLRFELVSDPDNLFQVSPDGIVQLQAGKSLGMFTDASITVRVWDGHGGSKLQELIIHADAPSNNSPPQIQVNGETDFTINDVATIAPFQNLVFADAEDDATSPATPITVLVSFLGQLTGGFENLPTNLPPGVDFVYTSGDSILIKGTHDQVTSILSQLQFNPNNRPDGAPDETTDFTVVVFDSQDVPSDPLHVHVTSHATGAMNHSPIIEIDPNGEPVPPTVSDLATFTPFKNLIFKDQDVNDTLTVTVSWTGADGEFDVSQAFGVTIEENNLNENFIRVSGSQDSLTSFFKALLFSPADFPNDPTGQDHPITFSVDVQDQSEAHDSIELSYSVLTENRAPDQIILNAAPIPEDAGVGQPVGTLTGHDPNLGDTIVSYRLVGDAEGRFTLEQFGTEWAIVVHGALDYETLPEAQKDQANNVGWYEITVVATDSHGQESAPIPVKVYIQNLQPEPDNTAPVISVDPNGTTEWFVNDTDTVAPFHDLSVSDFEDNRDGAIITVSLLIDDTMGGTFEYQADFPGVTLWPGEGALAIQGLQDDVNAFLKLVVFNPRNAMGPANSTIIQGITVTAFDSTGAWSTKHVTVNTTVTGNTVDNAAPVIAVSDTNPIPTTDWGPAVNPFTNVTLTDANGDELTLTISFSRDDGSLSGLPENTPSSYDSATGKITYTLTGSALALTTLLHGLAFDATEHDAPSNQPVTTQFTITLDDGHHAYPTSNSQVTVVSTITGPGANDDIYHVTAVGQTFGEDPDPAVGGYDKAYIHDIGGQYVLDDGDGIEVLEAFAENTSGIDVKGNNLDNTIVGGAFNDTLDGGSAGQDVLRGGLGDDTYIVSRQQGVTVEDVANETGGVDTIKLDGAVFNNNWAAYTLGGFIENLDASGSSGAVTLGGNELGNVITGNADSNILNGYDGDDVLDGGVGASPDILDGGTGNDTYRIRHLNDAIVDGADGGFDTAEITFSDEYRLAANAQIEVLKGVDGGAGVHLVGNAYSSIMLGSGTAAVSDTLDGGAGVGIVHTLVGGDGNDTYIVVNAGDMIVGEIDVDNANDDGTIHGNDDVAYIYRGLYATKEEWQSAIATYMSQGIERVITLDGVPEVPDNAAPTNVRLEDGTWTALVAENAGDQTVVAKVVADDDGDTAELAYEMTANTKFGIGENGEIYVLDGAELDLETQQTYTVHVRVRDQNGSGLYSAWTDITINLADVNEAADRIDFSDLKNLHVGDFGGALVVKATAHDPDIYTEANQHNHYRFLDGLGPDGLISSDGLFEIDAATGQVKVHADQLTDNDKGQHSLWIVAYDESDPSLVSQAFKYDVVVQDATGNQPPSNLRLTTGGTAIAVNENAGNDAFQYFVTADDDKQGPLKYFMDANDLFEIDQTTGQIRIKANATLDHEANATYTVTVRAQDGEGAISDPQTITITIGDVNEGPDTVAVAYVADVHAGSGQDIVVAQATAHDFDAPDSGFVANRFKFVDGAWSGTTSQDGLFVIDEYTGEIKTARDVVGSDVFSHNLKVVAYDDDGHVSAETTYTVDVGPAGNSAPSNITFSELFVAENPGPDAVLGLFQAQDGEQNPEALTFTLVEDGTNGGLTILNGNQLVVANPTKIDYEQYPTGSFTIKVKAFDGTDYSEVQTIEINIENLFKESVFGTEGNDLILGGATGDILRGNGGNDTLAGSWEMDRLFGGSGADSFVFDTNLTVTNHDLIMDFTVADGDRVLLKQSVFKGLGAPAAQGEPQQIAAAEFGLGTTATTASQRILYDQTTGNIYYDADGANGVAARLLATINNKPDGVNKPLLDASMFFVI